MRDLVKLIIVGVVMAFAPQIYAESYKVLIVPDNIVTDNASIDSYIYDATAEFFADGVANLLDNTDKISSQPVSQTRTQLKNDASSVNSAKQLTNRFKNTYNIDYDAVKKIGNKTGYRYVVMLTSSIDAENYILRRTLWDFLNIGGATVIDPAYKISTYAVLVDTKNNNKVWEDTYYKTISVCENRIITRGPSPQTEQLEKIKDYSRYICPQIAEQVQKHVLPADVYASESKQISYDIGNIDNVFTKKYRHYGRETNKLYKEKKSNFTDFNEKRKARLEEKRQQKALEQAEKEAELKVKATPVYDNVNEISSKTKINDKNIKETIYYDLDSVDLNVRRKKHNLFGDYNKNQPTLRDYN